jgi:glycosyltransferase involved in cell wall biosynthesis
VDGAREVCRPGETGFLLPPQSVDELAAALIELAGDRGLRERLGSTGRARFTEQFRHETMTRRIRQIYREILTATRRAEDSNPLDAPAGL